MWRNCGSVEPDGFTGRCGARPRRKAATLLAGAPPIAAGAPPPPPFRAGSELSPTSSPYRDSGRGRLSSVGSQEITQLLHEYGCVTVFTVVALQAVGCPLPGTTVLVAAALYASTAHGLSIAGVIAAGALGALCGTMAGFALGRRGGEPLLHAIGRRLRQSPTVSGGCGAKSQRRGRDGCSSRGSSRACATSADLSLAPAVCRLHGFFRSAPLRR